MDTTSVRAQIKDVTDQLSRIEREREILLTLKSGLEGWLSLYAVSGTEPAPRQTTLALLKPKRGSGGPAKPTGKPVGTSSLSATVLVVLKDEAGTAFHTDEILRRARDRGADSTAIDPEGVVELMLYKARKRGVPVERTGTKEWRWIGPPFRSSQAVPSAQ